MQTTEVDRRLAEAGRQLAMILVPGLRDSDEEHWQSHWEKRFPDWQRIRQREWYQADLDRWVLAIRRELANCMRPAVLIGHSFGALASCYVVQQGMEGIAGVMMVAPAEPMRFEIEERIQATRLSVPSLTFASHNDPLMTFSRAQRWSDEWGSELVDVGEAGHINAEAGFGRWEYGLNRLATFTETIIISHQ
ncbi:alpha/beta hydrolase [Brenneria roseae subsp. americana]|uniref:Alpha/beta hydrolase n=1 Tax=Brenneria roseae subsp. americana TaxID=1508507 RepID=A0A2U1TL46_9GAMM|nr:alpha/beta hydrolase [Brenneria roseae]PWC10148.1 alpha/beta hydrolase [Brenneria roseae subsp. americana]